MKRVINNKLGVSAVVATVLIVMITVAAVGIIWAVIIPMIRDNVGVGDVCRDIDISIVSSEGYTCYKPSNLTLIQIKKGNSNINVSGLKFYLSFLGNSREYSEDVFFSNNEYKTFPLNSSTISQIDRIEVVPIIQVGNQKKECSAVYTDNIVMCSENAISIGSGPGQINLGDILQETVGGEDGLGLDGVDGGICVPNCSCNVTTSIGETCPDGCGGSCQGTIVSESSLSLTDCGILDVPNKVYNLQNDVTSTGTCFTIAADNVTLNGNGKSVTGMGSGLGIISISNTRVNITIKNFASINSPTLGGIYVYNLSKSSFTNNTINSYDDGIYFQYDSINVSINNNHITSTYWNAIACYNSMIGLSITNNTLVSTTFNGLHLGETYSAFIDKNIIYGDTSGIISIGDPVFNSTISNNIITTSNEDGYAIGLEYSGASSINNTFINNTLVGPYDYLFYIEGNSTFNNVINNTVIGGGLVFYRNPANNNILANNIGGSIYLMNSASNNSILNNIINSSNDVGISLYLTSSPARNNIIANNSITSGQDGIDFNYSVNNTIKNNNITSGSASVKAWDGIWFANSAINDSYSNNYIKNLDTTGNAINSAGTGTYSNNAIIYNNSQGQINWVGSKWIIKRDILWAGGPSGEIQIGNNVVYLNTTRLPELNIFANITLNLGKVIASPVIKKDGVTCSAPNCNVLSNVAGVVKFNVTGWSNYTIEEA